MSTVARNIRSHVTRLIGFLAIIGLSLVGGVSVASADEVGNIDFENSTGSITVHKHEQPAGETSRGDGSKLDKAPANPLKDVTFTVRQVDIDLEVAKNWDILEDLTIDAEGAVVDAGGTTYEVSEESTTGVTDPGGIATFSGLDLGVYLVTETDAPDSVVAKAAPFLVVLPMPGTDGNWNYNVHVYPKNSQSSLSKKLNEDADNAPYYKGDTVQWDIVSTAPMLGPNDSITEYSFTDTLDPRLVALDPAVGNVTYDDSALDEEDYTVEVVEVTEDAPATVTVSLTDAGLAKVKAKPGKDLAFEVYTKVEGDIDDGVIVNKVQQKTVVNGQEKTLDAEDATYWGDLRTVKRDKDSDKLLAGARFEVHVATLNDEGEVESTAPILVGKEKLTVESDDEGVIAVKSLNVGGDNTSRTYCLVEVEAPAGYILPKDARACFKVKAGTNDFSEDPIYNAKQSTPKLPFTGAAGTVLFTLGGLAIVLIAAGVALRSARRAS